MCHLLLQHGESFSCGMWDLYLQHAGSLLLVYGIFCQGMHDLVVTCGMFLVGCGILHCGMRVFHLQCVVSLLWYAGSFSCVMQMFVVAHESWCGSLLLQVGSCFGM